MSRAPVVVVAAATWSSALVATHWSAAAWWLAPALWASALAAVGWLLRCRRGGLAAIALVFAAAAASHVAFAQPARAIVAAAAIDGGRAIEVHAVVSSKVQTGSAGAAGAQLHFDAQGSLIVVGSAQRAIDIPVVVWVAPDDVDSGEPLDLGSSIVARGTASRADPGDRAVLVVYASRGVDVTRPPPGGLSIASTLRAALVSNAARLPGPGAGLLPGLAVGDTSAVGPELDAAMKASSLSHLTAVSGANCAIVVGLLFAAAAAAGARRAVRVVFAAAGLGGFVVLVTPEPSVVRAAAMATIAMIGVLLGRPAAGLAVLAVAVSVLLVLDPWLSASLGFALSAAATGALLVLAPPLARGLERIMPRPLALALAVPLAAQLACGPLLVLISPVVPLYGVLANLVAGPGAPVATVTGLLACLAAPLPWLADGLTAIAWLPASWIAATALTVADLPSTSLPWWEGPPGAIALAGLGAAIAWVVARAGSVRRRDLVTRGLAGAVVAMTVGVLAGGAALDGPAGRFSLPPEWSVAACDVGQGDAVLVRSAGVVALIDTGPDPAPLAACLARVGIERIDLLVITHFDLDHVGGVEAARGRVGAVLHGPPAAPEHEHMLTRLAASGARLLGAHAGMSGGLGRADWRVVWPRSNGHAFASGNDASVVIEFRGGGVPRSVFLGDLSAAAQRAVVASGGLRPPYDLVKVAHHGSADQDAGLYRMLRPGVALVTVGIDNDYAHPRAEALDILRSLDARVARTDREGLIAITVTSDGLSIWRERGPPVAHG